jgi:coenzyme F420-reducing hydrogenase delta subunit
VIAPSMLCDYSQAEVLSGAAPLVTVFVCANCARSARTPESAYRSRPEVPRFAWPFPAQEVIVPCSGRLQPEHVLKAFESGARLVGVIGCEEDNCHYLEGSKRCSRRVEYLRGLLSEIGLGGERLLLFHLPGTAGEDMLVVTGRSSPGGSDETIDERVAAIREKVVDVLSWLTPTPLDISVSEAAQDPYQQVDTNYDDNED